MADYKKERIKNLVNTLNDFRDSYYNNSESPVSDAEYDELYDELSALEKETNFILSNSPTQTVGYEVKSKLEKTVHSHPMLSLGKTKSIEDLKSFAGDEECILMLKMDGLTCLLTYDNGKLIKAETRGDGSVGEDITHNAKVFDNVPLQINYKGYLELEGEAIITYDDFDKINATLPEEEKYKNPRNLASGSVRQLDSNIASKRHIKFITWKVPTIKNTSMIDALGYASELGFCVVPYELMHWKDSIDDYNLQINYLKTKAKDLGYPIDGMVLAYDDIDYGLSLGQTGHHPRHSIAFKFKEDEEITVLKKIEWGMGKTGILTPVAIFDPIELAGTTVERATVHNVSILKELDLRIGDQISVYKANEIIPNIRENLTRHDIKDIDVVQIPKCCPVCGGKTEVVKENDSEVLICTNPNCDGKLLGKLVQFCSKQGMDIDGLSEATLSLLLDRGYIGCGNFVPDNNPYMDIYHLSEYKAELSSLPKMGSRSVKKLLDSIEASRKTTLDKFLTALSIPGIGKNIAKDISKYCNGDVNEFISVMNHTPIEFAEIEGIGVTMITNLNNWWQENHSIFIELLDEVEMEILDKNKFDSDEHNTSANGNSIDGMNFVITGSLNHFKNRSELQNKIESLGGKVVGSVSKNTNILINNDINSTSSKNKKAKSLGIPIWTEETFLEYVG